MILFREARATILNLISEGVELYVKEHSSHPLDCLALYADPINGWVGICLESENAFNGKPSTASYGWKPAAEFSHFAWKEQEFPAWSQEYQDRAIVMIRTIAGFPIPLFPMLGDRLYSKPFFRLFFAIMNESVRNGAFEALPRKETFTVRVEDIHGEWDRDWKVPGSQ